MKSLGKARLTYVSSQGGVAGKEGKSNIKAESLFDNHKTNMNGIHL